MLLIFGRLVGFVMLLVSLGACSPALNWREVPNNQLGYVATFPDKPVSASRVLSLDGLSVPLTLQAARVDELYFSVGSVPLNQELSDNLDRLILVLAQSLGNNIGVEDVQLSDKTWLGRRSRFFDIDGTMPGGEPARLQGYFVENKGYLFQVILMGPKNQVSDVALIQWFTGFKLSGN